MRSAGVTDNFTNRSSQKCGWQLRFRLLWVIYFALGICLAFSISYLALFGEAGRSILFLGFGGSAIWGTAILVVIARIVYSLELNLVKGYFVLPISVGLVVAFCVMAVGVVAVFLGLLGLIALVPISVLLLSLCVMFAPDFFSTNRKSLSWEYFCVD